MSAIKIKSALISVWAKEGLDPILDRLHALGVKLYSTGGTQSYIEQRGLPVTAVEDLTTYPSILDGRVKTLHPKVHGGLLARREAKHLAQLEQYDIPEIDLVIVDLYPFEDTVAHSSEEADIIEKIDIGGIALIRAAAKNFEFVTVVPSREDYGFLQNLLDSKDGHTELAERRELARRAFKTSSHYDTAIFNYFSEGVAEETGLKLSLPQGRSLRYGENPHQSAVFHGNLADMLEQLNGKELSYNNLVDVDAAVQLMAEFKDAAPAFAVIKHTNACGVALRPSPLEAWQAALAGDPTSAFGGIIISNRPIDEATAQAIDSLFYEVLITPGFEPAAFSLLAKKKTRILLQLKHWALQPRQFKSLLNGAISQDADLQRESAEELRCVTQRQPSASEIEDMLFAAICAKHLKSNTIAIVKNQQLIGMGCGQTSRVDAMRQAVEKARHFGFDTKGAVMASDAFFPFPDSIEIGHEAGLSAVLQPGGSKNDQLCIDACDRFGMAMMLSGRRHFKH